MRIRDLVNPKQRRHIRALYNSIFHPQRKYSCDSTTIEIDKGDSFFGYYDINPYNEALRAILYLHINSDNNADIMMYDLENRTSKRICTTSIWNWQQGCRLRWANDKQHIFYNDLRDNRFVSVKRSIRSNDEIIYPYAAYDLDHRQAYLATLDFERLGHLRPGYGYVIRKYEEPNTDSLMENGISIIDLKTNECTSFISYEQIINQVYGSDIGDRIHNCYINHLSFSPCDNRLMFFWLEKLPTNIHFATLVVYNIDKRNLTVLENSLSSSHYTWIDNDTLLITAYDDKRRCRYYYYNLNNGKRTELLPDTLTEDGHPSKWKDYIITDTYPDKYGFEKVLKVDLKTNKIDTVCKVYHSYKVTGEQRCDLHPRICENSSYVCFDCNITGKREIKIVDIL